MGEKVCLILRADELLRIAESFGVAHKLLREYVFAVGSMERNVEDWSLRDEDRPYVRPERSFSTWPLALLAALAVGVGAIYYYYLSEHRAQPAPVAAAVPTPQAPSEPAAQSEPQEPTIRHRIEVPPVEVPK